MSICFKQVISLASKSVFVTKFACDNLAAKRFAVKLLNSEVVIYLSWSWSVNFFQCLVFLCYNLFFFAKLLTSVILFSTAAELVVKSLILGILTSISIILAF